MKRDAFTLIELLIVIIIIAIFMSFLLGDGSLGFLAFGWVVRTPWLIYRLVVYTPVFTFGVIAAFFACSGVLHLLVRKFRREWKCRQSLAVSGLFLTACVMLGGISTAFNIENELRHPKYLMGKSTRDYVWDNSRQSQLKIFIYENGVKDYVNAQPEKFLPPAGTRLEDGRLGHGWMTLLMPYIGPEAGAKFTQIDLDKPWNDPVNAPVFQESLPHIIDYSYVIKKDENGFLCTTFAANERVMAVGRSLRFDDITDGVSNTILIGEAAENLQPWGSPTNARDPALGVNRSPYGFGNRYPYDGTNFLMCDGSIRKVSKKTAPEILRAMATPNGGEKEITTEDWKSW